MPGKEMRTRLMKGIGPDTIAENIPDQRDGAAIPKQGMDTPQRRNGIEPVKCRRADDEVAGLWSLVQLLKGLLDYREFRARQADTQEFRKPPVWLDGEKPPWLMIQKMLGGEPRPRADLQYRYTGS